MKRHVMTSHKRAVATFFGWKGERLLTTSLSLSVASHILYAGRHALSLGSKTGDGFAVVLPPEPPEACSTLLDPDKTSECTCSRDSICTLSGCLPDLHEP